MNISKYIGLLALGLFAPSVSYAYVDPGSGSVIVTAALGVMAAIGYTCRKYFYKFKRLILGGKRENVVNSSENEGDKQ